nr:TraM recognition domain-containing protein [Mesorhizobium caraganae]
MSGSQIKLFIQINDLETSEFVSEMLGETTQVYKTPVMRPGQGIFAPRLWAPHYVPRPLRSPLELREMSARTSILMVKNSRSFQLTKIRHYKDQPYRRLFEVVKGQTPTLPALRKWHDEILSCAISPAPNPDAAEDEAEPPQLQRNAKKTPPEAAPKNEYARGSVKSPAEPAFLPAPPAIAKGIPVKQSRKVLALGEEPNAPQDENCNIRDLLAATERTQRDDFDVMAASTRTASISPKLEEALSALATLQERFGDD